MGKTRYTYRAGLILLARTMRKSMTASEAIIWERVRNRRLGGFKFYRQHVIKDFIVDFYNNDALIIVEIDGSAHNDREKRLEDIERDRALSFLGFHTIRFRAAQVELDADTVCAMILDEVYRRINDQLSEPLSG